MAQSGNDLTNNYLGQQRPAMNAVDRAAITPTQSSKFQSVSTQRAYLLTQGYTNAQLDIMTSNDMDFASRRKQGLK